MKKIFIILGLFAFTLVSFGQKKQIESVTVDTLLGVETDVFNLYDSNNLSTTNGILVFQALCTQVGGTSDGVGSLQFSVDGTSWVTYSDAVHNDGVRLFATDTSKLANLGNKFTITNGGTFGGWIKDNPFPYTRLSFTGTSGDTTKLTVKYAFTK